MRSFFAKIAFHKAVGLHLGEHEAAVSQVAATPFGPVEIASSSEPCGPNDLADVVGRLLGPLLGGKRRWPVAVGLPASRLFFSTRPVTGGSPTTAEELLQKALCSTTISVDDLTVDLIRGDVNKSPVASLAACRKKYMTSLVTTLGQLGVRPLRTEPSPCALVRLAAAQRRFPRRVKALLCVFLGAEQGLAVMVSGGLSLAWKSFSLPAGSEGPAILSAGRTLRLQQRHYGIESPPQHAIILGRPDLQERLQQEQFPSKIETRVLWHEGPGFDGPAAAFGLALGCLTQNAKAFDLSRCLKARPSLWEIFPWGDLAFTGALVAGMGLALGVRTAKLDDSYTTAKLQGSRYKCLSGAKPGNLAKDTEDRTKKVEAVRKFLDTRIIWSEYTGDIAARLPANAKLKRFDGSWGLDTGGRRGGLKRSLFLAVVAPLPPDGAAPRDIDAFLSALRNDPLLRRDFTSVELGDIKQSESRDRKTRTVLFTVKCLADPNGARSAKPAPKGAK